LDEKQCLTGVFSGSEIMNPNEPEKFIKFFNEELRKLSTGNNGK